MNMLYSNSRKSLNGRKYITFLSLPPSCCLEVGHEGWNSSNHLDLEDEGHTIRMAEERAGRGLAP